ncbi:MAG TPA: cytochrome c [Steroidobacteraceae bacterium]|nr:cytochrome c [Steroidobacteraceae bacterium]
MRPPLRRAGRRSAAAWLLTVGAATTGWPDSSGVAPTAAGSKLSGAEIYAHVCQACHMPQAQGAVGAGHYPKLAGSPALVSWQYAALTVLNGKNGMPAFGLPADQYEFVFGAVHLSDAEVALVVNYVRSHFGNKWKSSVTAAQVAALPHPH